MSQEILEAQLRQANKMEALARFARVVAHDFNTVLTIIAANERGLAFLQKPFSAEALARKVREVLG